MKPTIGLALTGSFCTIHRVLAIARTLTQEYDLVPIISRTVAECDTRFFPRGAICEELTALCGRLPLSCLEAVEPIGPQKLLDALVIAPCTGNTLSKLALGITDTPVTLAAKAHLRNRRPLLLAVATNDALAASAKNLGLLLNTKNIYFVPLSQDDPAEKERSLVCDFEKLPAALSAALNGRQLQPMLE